MQPLIDQLVFFSVNLINPKVVCAAGFAAEFISAMLFEHLQAQWESELWFLRVEFCLRSLDRGQKGHCQQGANWGFVSQRTRLVSHKATWLCMYYENGQFCRYLSRYTPYIVQIPKQEL